MKKKMHTAVVLAGLIGMASAMPVLAGGTGTEVEMLKEQIKLLIEQNQQLSSRVSQLEEMVGEKNAAAVSDQALEEKIHQLYEKEQKQEGEGLAAMINDHVSFSGLVEVEGSYSEDFEGINESKFELATVELGFDARANDWASGHVLVLYEEGGDDKVLIDEAFITLGNTEQFPLSLTAGRMYVPFGKFETNMISDPLTLEIAETQETALQIGFAARGAHGSVFAFNGDTNEGGGDSQIEQFGANLGYAYEQEGFSIDVGVSYMNSMGDSDGLGEMLKEKDLLESDYVDGLGVYAIAAIGPVSLIGEYITALDDFAGDDSRPMAFNFETGYSFVLAGRESTFAVAYQGTDDLAGMLPESRILTTLSVTIFPATTFSIEYAHDEDYDEAEGGTDESADTVTGQLAYEF
jgi:regulator of replication initiation timing